MEDQVDGCRLRTSSDLTLRAHKLFYLECMHRTQAEPTPVLFPAHQRPLPQCPAARASSGVDGLRFVPRAGQLPRGDLRRLRPGDTYRVLQVMTVASGAEDPFLRSLCFGISSRSNELLANYSESISDRAVCFLNL